MRKVLIIRFSALGDVAMLAPIVRAAAEQYPDVAFTMLSQERMADLFVGMPSNIVFHGVNLRKESLKQIVAGLGMYDLVADMHGVLRSVYIRSAMLLRGARVAPINKGRWSKQLLIHGLLHSPLIHTTERYAAVLAQLGLPITMPQFVQSSGTGIGIAPFAAHPGKIYPIEQMERVVALLSKHGEKIILFGGGKKEQTVLDSWAAKYPHVESIAGCKTLHEELEIMRGLRIMLTMDSANMHLASLVGTRVLSIWGATHPYAGFLGYGQREEDCICRELDCRPCSIYGNKKCRFSDYRCLDIAPEDIARTIIEAYDRRY